MLKGALNAVVGYYTYIPVAVTFFFKQIVWYSSEEHGWEGIIFTGCSDGVVRLWDPRVGKCLRELRGNDLDLIFESLPTSSNKAICSTSVMSTNTFFLQVIPT